VLSELMARTRSTANRRDDGFFGILTLLLGDRRHGAVSQRHDAADVTSRDTAPKRTGTAAVVDTLGRGRKRALSRAVAEGAVAPAHNAANTCWTGWNSVSCRCSSWSPGGWPGDRDISPTVPEFDYQRSDLPANVRYVGAWRINRMSASALRRGGLNSTAIDRSCTSPQGSIDKHAILGRRLEPHDRRARTAEDVIVVASTAAAVPTSKCDL